MGGDLDLFFRPFLEDLFSSIREDEFFAFWGEFEFLSCAGDGEVAPAVFGDILEGEEVELFLEWGIGVWVFGGIFWIFHSGGDFALKLVALQRGVWFAMVWEVLVPILGAGFLLF